MLRSAKPTQFRRAGRPCPPRVIPWRACRTPSSCDRQLGRVRVDLALEPLPALLKPKPELRDPRCRYSELLCDRGAVLYAARKKERAADLSFAAFESNLSQACKNQSEKRRFSAGVARSCLRQRFPASGSQLGRNHQGARRRSRCVVEYRSDITSRGPIFPPTRRPARTCLTANRAIAVGYAMSSLPSSTSRRYVLKQLAITSCVSSSRASCGTGRRAELMLGIATNQEDGSIARNSSMPSRTFGLRRLTFC